MTRHASWSLLALLATACGGATPPRTPAPTPTEAEQTFVVEAESLEALACGCKDVLCVVEAIDSVRWANTFRRVPAEPQLTDAGAARYGRAYLNATRCVKTSMEPPEPPAGAAPSDALTGMRELRGRACACIDAACIAQVDADFRALAEQHKDTKGSNAVAAQFKAEFDQLQVCIAAIKSEAPAP